MDFRRIIAASVALALIVAGLGVFFVYTHLTSLAQARAWVVHTHGVIELTQDLFSAVQDAEIRERGYVLTEDPIYLANSTNAVGDLAAREAGLEQKVSDNPEEVARVKALVAAINERQAFNERVLAIARDADFATARKMVLGGEERTAMNDIRRRVMEIRAVESSLLERRQSEANGQERLTLAIGMVLSLLALCGLVTGVIMMGQANRRLTKAIEEAKVAEAARAAIDALARAVFDNVPDLLFVLDVQPDDRYVVADVNPAFAKAINVRPDQVRGRSIPELIPGEAGERLLAYYRRVRASDRPLTSRDEIPRPGREPLIWESVLAPVKNPDGIADRILGSVRDITERVRDEERRRDSQRMEAVGQLTGGVAHDFNNLLQVIRGNLELLEGAVAKDERASQRLRSAIHGADRASQLTRQLLAFARRQPLEPQVINLSRLVSEMADLLRRTLGEAIEVETVVGGGLWNTIADPAQVESALLNLALNARDAMPDGGRLTVEITNASLDEQYARHARDVSPGQYVMLAVSDTGQGMSEATRARVFEPFFTTKVDGRGTGLGLSMVYGFVKQSNGHIQVYSEAGQGTTVKIYLPRSREKEAQATVEVGEGAADGENHVILVVEDEPAVRAATIALLEDLGYRHLEAEDAASALAVVESGASIDLVFTDVVMPGALKTRDFAQRLRELRPGLPILYTSGYTENAIVHHGRLDEGVSLISKPYAKAELARKIAKQLTAAQV